MRRFLIVTLFAAVLYPLAGITALAKFPSHRVNIVDPYPPGGVTDILARALAKELGQLWGQSVVVLNVPGAGSIIGAAKVAHAAPDGQTILFTIRPTVVNNRFLYKHLPYDPDKSLVPIMMIVRSGQLVVAAPSFPPNNLHQVVQAARQAPDKVAYASYGIGTEPNLMFATIGKREGVKFLHVPYKGVMPDIQAAMTGQVQITLAAPAVAAPMIRAGKLKALAVGGERRSILLPNVPTVAEEGFSYVNPELWWGLFAPGGTSPQLIERINHDVMSIVKKPEFIRKYVTHFGLELAADSPAQFKAQIAADVKAMAPMVEAAGVKPR